MLAFYQSSNDPRSLLSGECTFLTYLLNSFFVHITRSNLPFSCVFSFFVFFFSQLMVGFPTVGLGYIFGCLPFSLSFLLKILLKLAPYYRDDPPFCQQ